MKNQEQRRQEASIVERLLDNARALRTMEVVLGGREEESLLEKTSLRVRAQELYDRYKDILPDAPELAYLKSLVRRYESKNPLKRLREIVEDNTRELDLVKLKQRENYLSAWAKVINLPTDLLDLSPRTRGCLQAADLRYIGDLVTKTEAQCLKMRNFGRTSLRELQEELDKYGLHLGTDFEYTRPEESSIETR